MTFVMLAVEEGAEFIATFSSDRSHMLKDGCSCEYNSTPPPYPCILHAGLIDRYPKHIARDGARVVMREHDICICLSACIACQNLHGCFSCHRITCTACLVMPSVFMRLGGRVCWPFIFLHNHIHIRSHIHITHSTGTQNNVMDFATMDKRFFPHFVVPSLYCVLATCCKFF